MSECVQAVIGRVVWWGERLGLLPGNLGPRVEAPPVVSRFSSPVLVLELSLSVAVSWWFESWYLLWTLIAVVIGHEVLLFCGARAPNTILKYGAIAAAVVSVYACAGRA